MANHKRVKLKKDLVIPAGTIFSQAPTKTTRDDSFGEAVIGLTPDTFGTVTYEIWGDDKERVAEWFELVEDDMEPIKFGNKQDY